MYPPPIVKPPPGEEPTPKTVTSLHGNDYRTVLAFYTNLFAALGVEPQRIKAEFPTVMFGGALLLRDMGPPSANVEIVLYVARRDEVDAALDAVESDAERIDEDGRYFAMARDPDENVVWIVYDSPR